MEQTKYDVFISYSRADYLDQNNNVIIGSAVDVIVKILERNEINYWIDIDGDNTSDQYLAKISHAIDNSDIVLFVSSEISNGKESYWPIKEVSLAGEKHKRVLPVNIDGSRFNDNISLIFAGVDVIEYYKNQNQSLEKIIKFIKGNDVNFFSSTNLKQNNFLSLCKTFASLLLVLICVFTFFFSIGFAVGFFTHRADIEILMSSAFRNSELTAKNNHTICYSGKSIVFTYDVNTDMLELSNDTEIRFFDNITFESVAMAISIPLAFENLMKSAKYSGNGKIKVGILIVGSIGILCGYSIGEPIGSNYAQWQGERSLKEYFKRESTREKVRMMLNELYQ